MTRNRAFRFRSIIEVEIQQLLNRMKRDQFPDTVSSHERIPDESDQASAIMEKDIELRFRDRDRIRLKQLQNALSRIEKGAFGICESCRGTIPEKRLEHNPVASYCIECQDRAERRLGQNRRRSHFLA